MIGATAGSMFGAMVGSVHGSVFGSASSMFGAMVGSASSRVGSMFAAMGGGTTRTIDVHFGGTLVVILLVVNLVFLAIAIFVLVDVVRRPEEDFAVLGLPKVVVALVSVLTSILGVILYFAMWRPKLNEIRRARLAGTPMPPKSTWSSGSTPVVVVPGPGWYRSTVDPVGVLRWWDGTRWTADTHGAPMPPPSGTTAAPPPPPSGPPGA